MPVIHGECLATMRGMATDSIDAIVTDPPYGLQFMGARWDAQVPGAAVWREASRVLKPGGHLLAFAGTRTQHRMACAIEDGGFEIRDLIAWIYSSGMHTGANISKLIDKARGDIADILKVCWFLKVRTAEAGATNKSIDALFGFHGMAGHWTSTKRQPEIPNLVQWDALKAYLGFGDEMDAEVSRLNLRKGEPGEAWKGRPVTGQVTEWEARATYAFTSRDGLARDQAVSADAVKWDGWSTSVAPALEPITLARNPCRGTAAANVLEYGTGALNVDACRTEGGQLPKNLITDGSPLALAMIPPHVRRCYYHAKASKADRGEGNDHPTPKPVELMRYLVRLVTPPGGMVLDPFAGSGSTGVACALEGFDFVGIEREVAYVEIAQWRIAEALGET